MANNARPTLPSLLAGIWSDSLPAIGPKIADATGHGVINRPVSMVVMPCASNRNGIATNAMLDATNEHTDVATLSENAGMANSSTGSIGTRSRRCSLTNTTATTAAPSSSAPISHSFSPWPKPSTPAISRPNIAAFIAALRQSNLCVACGVIGKVRVIATAISPSGTLTKNRYGHGATDKMPAASEGPAAEDTDTISELIPIPRPSCARG